MYPIYIIREINNSKTYEPYKGDLLKKIGVEVNIYFHGEEKIAQCICDKLNAIEPGRFELFGFYPGG